MRYDKILPEKIFMAPIKIAITIDDKILRRLDLLVQSNVFPNRSKAIKEAIEDKLVRLDNTRLVQECAKLNPSFEQAIAEEGLSSALEESPPYGTRRSKSSHEIMG
jgi:Arc/MetJ-type ribon-helix-helix transcriptional regulator